MSGAPKVNPPLVAEGLRPPRLEPTEKENAGPPTAGARPRTPELKKLGEAFLALQKEEAQLAQLRSVWEEEDARAKQALERVELAAQRVAMVRAHLPEATMAEAAKTSPARPKWLAKKPAWLDKQTGVRLRNGQLGQPVSDGWVAVQRANGTYGFVPMGTVPGQEAAARERPASLPPRPASASQTSATSRSRAPPSVASSRRLKGRPSSAPGGRKDWPVTTAAALLDERLARLDGSPRSVAPSEKGTRMVGGRIFVDGVPADQGPNSVVNI